MIQAAVDAHATLVPSGGYRGVRSRESGGLECQ